MAVDPIRDGSDPQVRVAAAFTHELFEKHARMVYGLCRALLRDPDDADDATQATFISAYQSLLGGNRVREPAAWLATIARNECTARAQARMREPLPLLDADLGHSDGPEAELERQAIVAELQQAIATLPEKQREAVVLRDLYGLHYTEVGAALGISVASVESLLFRARRSLRGSLKPLTAGTLAVPVAVREGIAQALPAFSGIGTGGGATSGVVGLGLVAKLAGGPAVVKAAAGIAAAVAASSIAVAGIEHRDSRPQGRLQDRVAAAPVIAATAAHDDGVVIAPAAHQSSARIPTPRGRSDRADDGSPGGSREAIEQGDGSAGGASGSTSGERGSAPSSGKGSGGGPSSGSGSGGSEEQPEQNHGDVAAPRSPNSGPGGGGHDDEHSTAVSGASGTSGDSGESEFPESTESTESDSSGTGSSGSTTPGSGDSAESNGRDGGESSHSGDDGSHSGDGGDPVTPAL